MSDRMIGRTKIGVKARTPDLFPTKAHDDDAGYDLRADCELPVDLVPGERWACPTGVYLALPPGYEAQVRPRSGLAAKHGITIVNSPGTVDAGYRGELKIILLNTGEDRFEIRPGDRIAQMVIHKLPEVQLIALDSLDETDRGEGGFGSSGFRAIPGTDGDS